jgi:hypothetical protein
MRAWNATHPRENPVERIIGIDGEGKGRDPHLYNYLAAADEFGATWEIGDNPDRQLSTEECFEFALALPTRSLIFAYAFLYDLTKWCEDLDDRSLYLLFHEKKREVVRDGKAFYRPVRWPNPKTGPYVLNYMNRRFSLRRGNRRVTIWDIFAFFQSKFTKACSDWKIAAISELERMERMKEKRSTFDSQNYEEIKIYCREWECKNLAKLGRQLIDAHVDAGFPLTNYFGAGSTASALMTKYEVKGYIGTIPDAMKEAIACAFFGGRFENSIIGAVRRPVWNADISSAYPYAATFLPCLIHGHWKFSQGGKVDAAIERSRLALIKWHLPKTKYVGQSWGPLPVRKADGTIAFPLGAFSGWTWRDEFLKARCLRPDVAATAVWSYSTDCDCAPFSFLPGVYLERLRIGKEGPGIVLKLGPNSVYGKLVQHVGHNPPFQCFVWGGNITSSCRAQLLEALALAPSLSRVLMFATDGVWSDCQLALPKPRDTGTFDAIGKGDDKPKPLGGWEVKEYPRGVFAARPGIYCPLQPTEEDLQKVRARGLGRKVFYDAYAGVIDAYEHGATKVTINGGQRFIGAKTGMIWSPTNGVRRSEHYGKWLDWPVDVTFDPRPKRERVLDGGRLKCWDYFEAPSLPYSNAYKSDEDKLLQLAALIADEQPTGEFTKEDTQ